MTTRLSGGIEPIAGPHFRVERLELRLIGLGIRVIMVAPVRIRRAEGLGNVADVYFGIRDRLERMRIDIARAMSVGRAPTLGFVVMDSHRYDFSAFCQLHDRGLRCAGVDEPLQEAFEPQPIDEHDIGGGHGDGIGRLRLIDMGVAIRSHERRQFDAVTANVPGEIGDDGEAGDDLEILRRCRKRDCHCAQDDGQHDGGSKVLHHDGFLGWFRRFCADDGGPASAGCRASRMRSKRGRRHRPPG